jgi:predicted 2-oxoglutarate/Fe(II)-dependent dioxygenase YbiX/peroxiredoxin
VTSEPTMPGPDLAPGDRMPNFVLPGPDGKFYSFYERVRGNWTLLVFEPDFSGQSRRRLGELAAATHALADARIDVFAAGRGPVEACAAAVAELAIPFPVYADVKGMIFAGAHRLLGDPANDGTAIVLLLDRNQRLVARISGPDVSAMITRSVEAIADLPVEDAHVVSAAAPVLLLPRVLEPDTCARLIDRWRRHGHQEGTVDSVVDGEAVERVYTARKKRLDHRIDDPVLHRALAVRVLRRVTPELIKAFHFEHVRLDRFFIGCYQAERGDYFRVHRDNLAPANADRMFAVSINLNAEDYGGGGLRFPEYAAHDYRPGTGTALVFSCSLLHEALPVTRGERFVLLNFLRDARPRGPAQPDPARSGPERP